MKIGTIALVMVLPLALTARSAHAQPSDYDGNEDNGEETYDEAVPGEAVASVDVFYDRLADDGAWVDDPDIGHVFLPERENYVPYRDGHWNRTSAGFVWDSDDRFGWATSHYGRWAYSQPYSRWVWLPDTTWGPSWVEWRESGEHFGWAPLAPEVVIQAGYQPPIDSWRYVAGPRLLDVNVGRYYEPRDRVVTIHRGGARLDHYARVGGARVIVGPPAGRLRAHHITVTRPARIEARLVGRMSQGESRAAVQRAHDRHDVVEQQNRRRIESNTRIRDTYRRVGTEPRRVDPRRVEPRHDEPRRVEPRHEEPRRVEPRHEEPRRVEPRHEEPRRVEPRHEEPRRVEPRHEEPRRVEPRHEEPRRVEPRHEEPRRVEPRHDEPRRVEPRPTTPTTPRAEPRQEPKRVEPRPTTPHAEPKHEEKHEHH